jgi:aspartate racemase
MQIKSGEQRTVGILGGMGPAATIDFMSRVLAATPAASDQQHIRMLVDHNPSLPNRHQAIASGSQEVAEQLAAMARGLETSGADFLVMPCNTAHAFSAEIRGAVTIPLVSIIELTVDALAGTPAQAVGVMAARGCLEAGLYQQTLEKAGHSPVLWQGSELEQFMELVYRVKAGEINAATRQTMRSLARALHNRGAQTLIAGCTEIPLLISATESTLPILDSTHLLAQRTVALARGLD